MRNLLGFFIIAIVVFTLLPVHTLVYRTPCPQCQETETECPACPLPPVAGAMTIMGFCFYGPHFDVIFCEIPLALVKKEGYKYAIVVPFPQSRVLFGEFIDWDTLDMWGFGVEYLNETHSYFEIESVGYIGYTFWYYVHGLTAWWEIYDGRYITIYVIREDVDPRSVLS